MDRRRFLSEAPAAFLLPLASGCVARNPGNGNPETSSGKVADSTDAETRDESDSDDSTPMESRGPVRGESDADVEALDVEDDENVEYVPEDDAVRYVAAWRHTNHEEIEEGEPPEREPVYETTPFERWVKTNCLSAAARAAANHAADELDADGVGSGISSAIEGRDLAAVVSISTVIDRNGDVVSDTAIEFDALVAATPATVAATYRLGDRKYDLKAPIYVRYEVLHQT